MPSPTSLPVYPLPARPHGAGPNFRMGPVGRTTHNAPHTSERVRGAKRSIRCGN
jgi:hypothetical protein